MPGDDIVPRASFNATRAITIKGPPEKVWPWIVQMGYRRKGQQVALGVRPEDVHIATGSDPAPLCFDATVEVVEPLGHEVDLFGGVDAAANGIERDHAAVIVAPRVERLAGGRALSEIRRASPLGDAFPRSLRLRYLFAGFVVPGTRVDVLLTGNPGGANEQQTTTVLENVAVIAAGQKLERNAAGEPQSTPVITLLVSPDDAQKLTLASSQGHIQLALRNPIDTKKEELPGTKAGGLYRGVPTAPARCSGRMWQCIRAASWASTATAPEPF